MNGSIGIMGASGLSEDIGVELGTGVNEVIEISMDEAKPGFDPALRRT